MKEIEIREIELTDAAAAAVLSAQLGYPCTTTEMSERIVWLQHSTVDEAWVAMQQGRVVGWLQVTRMLRIHSGIWAEITGLVVDEDARGQHVGKQLVERAAAWAHDHKIPKLIVRANLARLAAHGFYAHLGCKEQKRHIVFDVPMALVH